MDRKFVLRYFTAVLAVCLLLTVYPTAAPGLEGKLNINTASVEELQDLPLIGKAKAREIVNYRKKYGTINNLDELAGIEAIGPTTLEAIRPYLLLSGNSTHKNSTENGRIPPGVFSRPGEIMTLADGDYFNSLVSHLRGARHEINIAMYLFKTTATPGNRATILVNELIAARRRNVRVRVVLEKSDYDDELNKENRAVARTLGANHIEVGFDAPKTTSHAKLVIIDNRYVFAGSHNFTHSALARNHELSLLIDNPKLAAELNSYIDNKIRKN